MAVDMTELLAGIAKLSKEDKQKTLAFIRKLKRDRPHQTTDTLENKL